METAREVRFTCPQCRGELHSGEGSYRCSSCGIDFPVIAGIADFRLSPDPWIGIEQDREKALGIEEATRELTFEDAVRAYWQMTPDTPSDRAARFQEHVRIAAARSREWLETLPPTAHSLSAEPWIELGCGSGDLVAAGRTRGISIIGIDIALRWLVIARKRPELEAGNARFVCCGAEHLPFPDGAFGRVVSLGLLEHCADPGAVCREARRILRVGGSLHLRTVNRYSLLAEPHVDVWGVGYVPRRFADSYVRLRSGRSYLHHRPLSPRELEAALREAGFQRILVRAAPSLPGERARLGATARAIAPGYEVARRTPFARSALTWIAPLLEASGAIA
jgi:ubiquinone/menaquinone biosynthesis C-methylase UbiE